MVAIADRKRWKRKGEAFIQEWAVEEEEEEAS